MRFDDVFAQWSVAWDTSRLADLRCRWWNLSYGDQGLFVRRQTFMDVGGFSTTRRYEDPHLALRLAQCGQFRLLGPPAISSSRRFQRLPVSTTARDTWTTFKLISTQFGHSRRIAQ